MIHFRSVQTKIAMLSGACLVLTAGVIGTTSSFMLRDSATQAARAHAGGAAAAQAGDIRSSLNRALSIAESLSNTLGGVNDPAINLAMPRESAIAILGSFLTTETEVNAIFTAWEPDAFDGMDIAYQDVTGHDASGRFIPFAYRDGAGQPTVRPAQSIDDPTTDASGIRLGEAYLRVKETGRPVILPPRTPPGGDQTVVRVAAPIRVGDRFFGVVGVDLNLDFIDQTLANASELGERAEIAVFSENGVIAGWTGKPEALGRPADSVEPGLAAVIEETLRSGVNQSVADGFMESFVRVDIAGVAEPWIVAARVPESTALAGVQAALRTQIVISIALVGLGLIAVFFAARSVSRPIRTAADMLRDIAEGEGDLTRRLSVSGRDELGALASGFNAFAERINALLLDVRLVSDSVSVVADDMVRSSTDTLGDMENQRQQAFQVSAAIEQMAASVTEVSDKAATTRERSDQAGELARRGSRAVTETVDGINAIRNGVGVAMEAVNELGRSSDQIGEIIAMINDIADQTNLLALNAAIEAARAGEHGRGFAVVADEVRKLAERTQSATGQVGGVIAGIQAKTREAVTLMNESAGRVDSGVATARSAGETLDEIVGSSADVAGMIGGITATFHEQATASRNISQSMDEINQLTEKTSDSSRVSAERSSDLSSSVERLRGLLGGFRLD